LPKRIYMKTTGLLLVFVLSAAAALAAPTYTNDYNKDGTPDQWYEMSGNRITGVSMDRNYDGRVDYTVHYDTGGRKISEEMDFNYDGSMDDFYFYESGKLIREEIDTNYDGRIDVWVFLDGLYIRRYEVDTDYDGAVDRVKDYAAASGQD
jgi:hypothetical protein